MGRFNAFAGTNLFPAAFTNIIFSNALFSGLCLLGAWWLDSYAPFPLWTIAVTIFVITWEGKFYGHKVEGKKNSIFKDLQFLLIGPAWLMHFIFIKMKLKY